MSRSALICLAFGLLLGVSLPRPAHAACPRHLLARGSAGRSLQQFDDSTAPPPPPPPPPPPFITLPELEVDNNSTVDDVVEEQYRPLIKALSEFLETTKSTPNSTRNTTNFWAPRMLRLAWHTSGTYDPTTGLGGSDGSTMRFYPEKNFTDNMGLEVPRMQLEQFKDQFPWVTYADLWTLAGCVAVKNMGGPRIRWRPGRMDAPDNSTSPPDGLLPDASKGAEHVRDVFEKRLEFDDSETVALIGAHAVGGCHQNISGYKGAWSLTPQNFSNAYFVNLLDIEWHNKTTDLGRPWTGKRQFESPVLGMDGTREIMLMMLPTDMALKEDPVFRPWVEAYAKNETHFFEVFASAFERVLDLGVPFTAEDTPILV